MKRSTAIIAALTAALILLTGTPALANTTTRYVYVEDHTGTAWPVTRAEPYIDQHTSSVMIYGRCRAGHRCIRIYEKTIRTEWAAVTRWTTWTNAYIYVNPQRNNYPYRWRYHIIAHELAHAMGATHTTYCSLMYWRVHCPDGTVSMWLAPYTRRQLAAN